MTNSLSLFFHWLCWLYNLNSSFLSHQWLWLCYARVICSCRMGYVWSVLDKRPNLQCNITTITAGWILDWGGLSLYMVETISFSHVEVLLISLSFRSQHIVSHCVLFHTTGGYCRWVFEEASLLGLKHQDLRSSGKGLPIGTTRQWEPGVTPKSQSLIFLTFSELKRKMAKFYIWRTRNVLLLLDQYKKVKEFVRVAQEEGATLVCGGKRPDVSASFALCIAYFWIKSMYF